MMKRRMIVAVAALILTGSMSAQDTINGYMPLGNYFCGSPWPQLQAAAPMLWGASPTMDEQAYFMQTDDTLTVYGIAGSLSTMALMYPSDSTWAWELAACQDPTYKESYEFLRLYEADPDTPRMVGQVKVHLTVTPISYYINTGLPQYLPNAMVPILPMYEQYFEEPVMVADSFYIGRTMRTGKYVLSPSGQSTGQMKNPPVTLNGLGDRWLRWRKVVDHRDTATSLDTWEPYNTSHYGWSYSMHEHVAFLYLFPIRTPNPDTTDNGRDTIVGGDTTRVDPDTLGIQSVELLKRYTSVQPNPATETAKVISSFGLTRIEAFNSAGDRVYDAPHTGLTATLDVSRWPAGTYILRLHTPAGTVGKKILVRPVGQ